MVKRNFFRKLLFFYLGIVVLYTSVISVIICYRGFESSLLQTHHSHQRYVEQASTYVDYKLQSAFELVYKISTLESFVDYRYSETTDYLLITSLFNDLTSYLNDFSSSGFTLGVTKLTDDIVITRAGTFSMAHYLEEAGIAPSAFLSFIDYEPAFGMEYTYVIPSAAMVSPNKMVILHKLKGNSRMEPIYIFITLDTAVLLAKDNQNVLGDFNLYTDEPVVCLSAGLGLFNAQALDFVKSIRTPAAEDNLKIDQFTHYIYSSEVIKDLKYVYTTRALSWISIITGTLETALLPMLVLLLVSVWLSCKAVNSTYKPIRALVKFISDQDHKSSSADEELAASELEYIQSNIERIYTDNHTLQNNLDQSLIGLREDFFRKVIYGIVDEDYIQDNLSVLNLLEYNHPLRLLLLDCEGMEHNNSLISYKSFSLMVHELIEAFQKLSGPSFVLPLDTKKYCIILIDEPEEVLISLGNYMIQELSLNLSLDVMVCLSGVYPLADLTSGLHELLTLNNYKYSFMDERILTREAIKERKETTYLYPLETEACLINYISSNDYDKGKYLLTQLIDKNLGEIPLTPANMNHIKYSLVTTFKRSLNEDGKSFQQFIREYPSAVEEFLEITPAQLKDGCLTLYDIIFQFCNRDKFSLESSTASKIFMYIHENFDKDISLTDIAQHFNLSESYISKLFKNSLDVNFKTYVNKLKIKKAKELLNTKNYKVSDITAMVGCNNTNTFIRIFKQYEGVSPGEYMKNLK